MRGAVTCSNCGCNVPPSALNANCPACGVALAEVGATGWTKAGLGTRQRVVTRRHTERVEGDSVVAVGRRCSNCGSPVVDPAAVECDHCGTAVGRVENEVAAADKKPIAGPLSEEASDRLRQQLRALAAAAPEDQRPTWAAAEAQLVAGCPACGDHQLKLIFGARARSRVVLANGREAGAVTRWLARRAAAQVPGERPGSRPKIVCGRCGHRSPVVVG